MLSLMFAQRLEGLGLTSICEKIPVQIYSRNAVEKQLLILRPKKKEEPHALKDLLILQGKRNIYP